MLSVNASTKINKDTLMIGLLKLYCMLPNVDDATFLQQASKFFPKVKIVALIDAIHQAKAFRIAIRK